MTQPTELTGREKFWSKAPTLEYRGNGTVVVKCGDCGWSNDTLTKTKSEAMVMLGTHYLVTSRHKGIDEVAAREVTLAE